MTCINTLRPPRHKPSRESRSPATTPGDIAAEHRAIADLTVARDEAGATRVLREHIERTTAALVRYVERADDRSDSSIA